MRTVLETYAGGSWQVPSDEDGQNEIAMAIERVRRLMGNDYDANNPPSNYIFVANTDTGIVDPVRIVVGPTPTPNMPGKYLAVHALPEWQVLVIHKQKINAIKALRNIAGPSTAGSYITLMQAKLIVEDFATRVGV